MNGFKNYETWAASLWLENTEAQYNHYYGIYKAAERQSGKESAVVSLAEIIKSDIEEGSPLDVGLYADLLNAAIANIDFIEVAEHFADE